MSRPATVFLVDPSGFYRLDVSCALSAIGCQIVASVGNLQNAINALDFVLRIRAVDILIIDGDDKEAEDIGLEVLSRISVGEIIEHSNKTHGISNIFVSKNDGKRGSLEVLCETVKLLIKELV